MSERDLDDLLYALQDTANPADDLAASEARLLDRLDRTMASRPRALRAAFRAARRTVLAAVAIGGVATGAAATAAISFAVPNGSPTNIEIVADPANPSKIVFSAVQRSTQEPDPHHLRLFKALKTNAPDVRPEDARGIRTADGVQTWVVPGATRTCFGAENGDGTGYTCTSNARVMRGGLSTASVDTDGTVHAIYLVPDSIVSARAGGQDFSPQNNLLSLSYPTGSTVTFTTQSGDITAHRD